MTARKRKILIVDSDPHIGALTFTLQTWGFDPLNACDPAEATAIVERHHPDIVITDVVMVETSGLEFLKKLKSGDPHRPVLLLTSQGCVGDIAAEAMKLGARDFLTKPLTDFPKLKSLLDDAEREIELRRKAKRLTTQIEADGVLSDFVGTSKAMRDVFALIESVAKRDVSIMITGESGAGKNAAARTIHRLSRRFGKPFVTFNTFTGAKRSAGNKGSRWGSKSSRRCRYRHTNCEADAARSSYVSEESYDSYPP